MKLVMKSETCTRREHEADFALMKFRRREKDRLNLDLVRFFEIQTDVNVTSVLIPVRSDFFFNIPLVNAI